MRPDRTSRRPRALRRAMAALAVAAAVAVAAPAAGQAGPVDSLLARGRLQEAAWAARASGDTARATTILARLDTILRSAPRGARPLSMDSQGVSYTFHFDYGGGVGAIFKVDGSDIFCPECGADREVAVYRIDRLLGLDLTPVTVPQELAEAHDTLHGSAMYFVHDARLPGDAGARKPDRLRFFDAVVGNSDRHQSNWLLDPDGRVVAIDHNRAFEYRPSTRPKTCWETEVDSLAHPEALGRPFDRYRDLPADSLAAAVADVLDPALVRRFVAMRDRVVARIEARIQHPRRALPHQDCVFERRDDGGERHDDRGESIGGG